MNFLEAVVLGILQGVFEWLPVSSEAVITLTMTQLLGSGAAESVNTAIWLHTGTMLAALLYFRDEFRSLILQAGDSALHPQRVLSFHSYPVLAFVVVATAVTGALGGVLYLYGVEALTADADLLAGVMAAALFATGVLRLYNPEVDREETDVDAWDAVITGGLQGLAVLPGISRSGSTVFGLFYREFDADAAFRLSFLLSVPAVFLANIGINLFSGFAVSGPLLVAAGVAAVVGYETIDAVLAVADRAGVAALCFVLAALSLLSIIL